MLGTLRFPGQPRMVNLFYASYSHFQKRGGLAKLWLCWNSRSHQPGSNLSQLLMNKWPPGSRHPNQEGHPSSAFIFVCQDFHPHTHPSPYFLSHFTVGLEQALQGRHWNRRRQTWEQTWDSYVSHHFASTSNSPRPGPGVPTQFPRAL